MDGWSGKEWPFSTLPHRPPALGPTPLARCGPTTRGYISELLAGGEHADPKLGHSAPKHDGRALNTAVGGASAVVGR